MVPLCFVLAWTIVILGLWSLWATGRDSLANARRMHQIPCSDCRYFTNQYQLKCPVHPSQALSEAAIGCPDFESVMVSCSTEN
ncbi:MAG: hypothetical protein HC886_03420 [Leptolyngbyaceae cyanobacterium SM1_1_3]|nr:hypothetical protein [Leptolyngbyaceae cyanobacterium SM1_1_3]NJN02905.1 hypothetical protein [Leptolyngbyaceae cyanobacterium RM1_1_2]NJO09443.1 hypothetical protein [Leptolyngbyaceae cyanobacterium SL_1_1]